MIYRVGIKEVHEQGVYVEANSEEEAKEKVEGGDYIDAVDDFEFCHTLEAEYWTVQEEKDEDGFVKKLLDSN